MNKLKNYKIILASKSPRRRELMTQAGFDFDVITSNVEEVITGTNPADIVKELSLQKASAVLNDILAHLPFETDSSAPCLLVIGADTVVSYDDKIMGKPKDKQDAFNMIKTIQGKTHQVYTGVSILRYDFGAKKTSVTSFAEGTDVTLYSMSDSEINDYIATNEPMDKAGSYGIQGRFAVHVRGINGDYNNVVGLPIARLYQELRTLENM